MIFFYLLNYCGCFRVKIRAQKQELDSVLMMLLNYFYKIYPNSTYKFLMIVQSKQCTSVSCYLYFQSWLTCLSSDLTSPAIRSQRFLQPTGS